MPDNTQLTDTGKSHQIWLTSSLSGIAILFLILRFLHLNADFPLGVIDSGALYTDEGWYASAAIQHHLTGSWYLAGDFNPAINMPVGPFLQFIAFSKLGLSLLSARIATATIFVLLFLAVVIFAHRRFGNLASLLTALLLSTNFVVFSYSRLALLEFSATFFCFLGLALADSQRKNWRNYKIFLASALVSIGILTKTTMIFSIPLLFFLFWICGRNSIERLKFSMAPIAIVICLVGGYHLYARYMFPLDYSYFNNLNISGRYHKNIVDWISYLPRVLIHTTTLGAYFVDAALATTASALFVSSSYRKDPTVQMLIAFLISYICILSISAYGPQRYYLPLTVPISILFSSACIELRKWLIQSMNARRSVIAFLPVIPILLLALGGGVNILIYLSTPIFSFTNMANDAKRIIEYREGNTTEIILLGHIADSAALECGIRPLNSTLGTQSLSWKLRKYHPQYFLVHTDTDALATIAREHGHTTTLASWDVYGNYYGGGKKVELMHIAWDQHY